MVVKFCWPFQNHVANTWFTLNQLDVPYKNSRLNLSNLSLILRIKRVHETSASQNPYVFFWNVCQQIGNRVWFPAQPDLSARVLASTIESLTSQARNLEMVGSHGEKTNGEKSEFSICLVLTETSPIGSLNFRGMIWRRMRGRRFTWGFTNPFAALLGHWFIRW